MESYRDLYLHMTHETEKAIRILIEAQQACEEAIISQKEAECIVFPSKNQK